MPGSQFFTKNEEILLKKKKKRFESRIRATEFDLISDVIGISTGAYFTSSQSSRIAQEEKKVVPGRKNKSVLTDQTSEVWVLEYGRTEFFSFRTLSHDKTTHAGA